MNPLTITTALAHEQIRDRTELARQSRLAALARCCHPSTWRHALARAIAAAQSTLHRPEPQATVCCS